MSQSTTTDIKQGNYLNIYRLFFQHDQLSKTQIARLLDLSLPTIMNNISQLEQEGKIQEVGVFTPQGGRPATAYQLVNDAVVSIGVEIQARSVRCATIDLKGDIIKLENRPLAFVNSQNYIVILSQFINEFINGQQYQPAQILGVGISFQGIANKNGQSILYGEILPYDYLTSANLQSYLGYPIVLLHDVKCAASAELWLSSSKVNNAIYVSISEHLGGALIVNHRVNYGKQGYSGALEHICVGGKGKRCYCGQIGCLETYCSLTALLENKETLSQFFETLRAGNTTVRLRWQNFLNYLAKAINTAYLLLERDIILGGEIAPYLKDTDIAILVQLVKQRHPFALPDDFIRISSVQNNASLVGAGLYFIRQARP